MPGQDNRASWAERGVCAPDASAAAPAKTISEGGKVHDGAARALTAPRKRLQGSIDIGILYTPNSS
jgi:hypothetical protein